MAEQASKSAAEVEELVNSALDQATIDVKKEDDAKAAAAAAEAAAAGDGAEGTPVAKDVSLEGAAAAMSMSKEALYEKLSQMKLEMASKKSEAGAHKFWDTQPVPKLGENVVDDGPVDEIKTVEQVRKEPYTLPAPYTWVSVDVTDSEQLDEVYELLCNHYVEDDDNMFRFDYSREFLKWALTPPGFFQDWHVGIRHSKTNALMAFITGVPATIKVKTKDVKCAEINFLCAHKKLRAKRLAPVLIKEVTRRVNLQDVWQAVYTAGVVLPKPIAACRYWHRTLRPKKLIECQFTRLAPRMTMARTIKLHKVPDEPKIPGIRPMEPKDVPKAHALVMNYLSKFDLFINFDEDEFAHWLLPREGVVNSFVVENKEGDITDFASFYWLPSSVMNNPLHTKLYAGYSFYNVATSVPLFDLMKDLLIYAYKYNMDVFNALDVMENGTVFEDLKFGIGDGHLQYYLYNWRSPTITADKVALVLL